MGVSSSDRNDSATPAKVCGIPDSVNTAYMRTSTMEYSLR